MNESEVCRTCGHFVGTEKHQCDACRTEFRLRDQLTAATKRADNAEHERDAITAKCDVLLKLNGDLNKNNDHVIAAHESLRLELGLEVRESFEDAVRAIVSQRDAALGIDTKEDEG